MHQIWYDDARIERTVKRDFVCSYLDPEEIENLDKPLLFGDGLTNDTYWDWLETKAKRLFLILLELDLPDQIFGVIDDSWEDDDLPIPLDQIHRLALTEERDLRLEKRFYDLQFSYLLRTLQRGEHVDYGDQELVPLEIADKRPVSAHQDTVVLPQCPGRLFSRRGIQLGLHMSREDFMYEISLIQDLQNEHVESYFASYTQHDHAYVLFTPACEYKLSSYLSNTPTTLKNVDKLAKRLMVLDWIHCLVDTLSFIHSNGEALGNLRPSTISFTQDHCIVLRDNTCFNPETLRQQQQQQRSFSKEGYDYAAPEQCSRPSGLPSVSVRNRTWTMSSASDSSKSRSSTFAISRGMPMEQQQQPSSSRYYPPSSNTPPAGAPRQHTNFHNHNNISDPQAADIFSLGCIILDLLSHGLLKRSTSAFATVRSAKHKIAGRGGAVLDSSFHRNLGQVEVWMNGLSKDADKKVDDATEKGRLYKAVTPILHVVERMLAVQPGERPSAMQVQAWVYQIMTEVGGIQEPHCVHQYGGRDDGDVGAEGGMLGGGAGGFNGAAVHATTSSSNSFLHLPMMSPTFAQEHHHAGAAGSARGQASSAPTILSKRSSIFSIRTLGGHRRTGSSDDSSSVGKASIYHYSSSQEADRWNLGAGWVNSMQNLRIGSSSKTRLWQSPSQAGSAVSSS